MHLPSVACVLASAVAVSACAGTAGPIFSKHTYPRETVPASIAELVVHDARGKVTTDSFDTPLVSWPGDGESRPVELTAHTAQEMRTRIARLIPGGVHQLRVEIEITGGSASWKGGWTAETARAEVKLQVTFRLVPSGQVVLIAWGEAWGERWKLDVADDEPGKLFQSAVLAAFDRAVATPMVVQTLARAVGSGPSMPRARPQAIADESRTR